ncbi:MAG: hypothetical protein K2L64_00780, partial [Ureaplasma sp.]|nr:hypothetical protein [Ureaplasma sp.]
MIEDNKKKKKISYKQKVTRSIMWSALGIAIYTTAISLPILLINAQVEDITFTISYENLLKIRNYIINEYGANSLTNPLTFSELKQKCENGEIKNWIIDNFSDFFVQIQKEDTRRIQRNVDFKLEAEKTNDSILITMSKFSNTIIKVDNLENEDLNSVYTQNNNIVFKFNISDFVETKKLNYSGFNQFKTNLITQMQLNKITFENLRSNFNIQV